MARLEIVVERIKNVVNSFNTAAFCSYGAWLSSASHRYLRFV